MKNNTVFVDYFIREMSETCENALTALILQYFKELSGHGRRPLVPECHVKNKNYQRGAAMRLRKVSREVRPRTPVSRSFQSTTVRGKKENLYTSVRQES